MRLGKRAGALLLGAAVLFLIGTNVQAGMLFVLAALFLGALLAGILLPLGALRGLEATLVAPDEATVREHARHGGFPADRVSEVRSVIDPTTAEKM